MHGHDGALAFTQLGSAEAVARAADIVTRLYGAQDQLEDPEAPPQWSHGGPASLTTTSEPEATTRPPPQSLDTTASPSALSGAGPSPSPATPAPRAARVPSGAVAEAEDTEPSWFA